MRTNTSANTAPHRTAIFNLQFFNLKFLFCPLAVCLLPSALCLWAWGQSYTIDWSKIAGGGGASSNGAFVISGTIGQHDAGGPLTGGPYSLVGGFWALPVAVQTPGSPTLKIVPATPGYATVSWTPSTPGFVLQCRDSLSPTNWINASSGATNPVTVPVVLPTRFYRLMYP